MLQKYVLSELKSPEPLMRLRACWTYGVFGSSVDFSEEHQCQVAEGIFQNMTAEQPLPVRFYASSAFDKILR